MRCSAQFKEAGRTVQLSNTGISPGSGAMNRRRELSRQTLGVPVISMGVPTVADGVTVGCDLLAVEGVDDEEAAPGTFCTRRAIDAGNTERGGSSHRTCI